MSSVAGELWWLSILGSLKVKYLQSLFQNVKSKTNLRLVKATALFFQHGQDKEPGIQNSKSEGRRSDGIAHWKWVEESQRETWHLTELHLSVTLQGPSRVLLSMRAGAQCIFLRWVICEETLKINVPVFTLLIYHWIILLLLELKYVLFTDYFYFILLFYFIYFILFCFVLFLFKVSFGIKVLVIKGGLIIWLITTEGLNVLKIVKKGSIFHKPIK